jgi:hypothetical protein
MSFFNFYIKLLDNIVYSDIKSDGKTYNNTFEIQFINFSDTYTYIIKPNEKLKIMLNQIDANKVYSITFMEQKMSYTIISKTDVVPKSDILFKDKNADFFIAQYNIFDENKFKFILQKYFFNHKLIFGGIPFSLDENEKYNRHILICLSFFFNYRILSNKTFLDFLDILKKENNERVTLTEYKSIEEVTRKKLVDIGSVSLSLKSSFDKCKIIIQYSIEFVNKLYLDTFKSLKKTKNKNTLVGQSDIDKKIGYFKQNVYTFIYKLQDYLKNLQTQFPDKNITNFFLFLCGYLLQYIYFLEVFNKTKNEFSRRSRRKIL